MKLLWVTPYLPYPPSHGGKVRVYNLLARLGARHEIHLVAVNDTNASAPDLGPLTESCASITVIPRRGHSGIVARVWEALSPKPMVVMEATTPDGLRQVDWLLAKNTYDAAVVEQVQGTAYLRPIRRRRVPTLLICHNVERRIWEGFAKYAPSRRKKLRAQFEARRLRRFEPAVVRAATARLAVSEEDRREIERMAGVPCGISPNGVDIDYYAFRPRRERSPEALWRLVMTGSMNYVPNIDAAHFLMDDILPLVQRTQPMVEVAFVGSNPDSNLLAREEKESAVRFTGFVEDVRPYIAEADVFIAPLRHGSGTRLKLLEAMAQGIPIVTTSVGCEGLDVRHREHLWIADTPADFAAGIAAVITDPTLAGAMTANARALVERTYSWERIAGELEVALLGIARQPMGIVQRSATR